MEAYKVDTVLNIKNNVSAILTQIRSDFLETQRAFENLQRMMMGGLSTKGSAADKDAAATMMGSGTDDAVREVKERNERERRDERSRAEAHAAEMEAIMGGGRRGGGGVSIRGGLHSVAGLAMDGAIAGYATKLAFGPSFEGANETQKLLTILGEPDKMGAALAQANKTSADVPVTSINENIHEIAELVPVFNNSLKEVVDNLTNVQTLTYAMVVNGGSKDQAYPMARLLELRAAQNDPKRFMAEGTEIARVAEYTKNRVDANQMVNAGLQAAPYTTGFSPEFMYRYLPTLIQDVKSGFKAGTMLNAFEVSGLRMSKASYKEAMSHGLIRKGAKVTAGTAGQVVLDNPEDLVDADLRTSNPFAYVEKNILPWLDKLSPAKKNAAIQRLFPRQTAARFVQSVDTMNLQYHKDAGGIAGTQDPVEAAKRMMQSNPNTLLLENEKQFNNLLKELGELVLPPTIWALRNLVTVLKDITGLISDAKVTHIPDDPAHPHKGIWQTLKDVPSLFTGFHVGRVHKDDQATYMPPQSSGQTQAKGDVYLDSKKVGNVLWDNANRNMSVPVNNSGMSFDPRMSPVPNN